MQHINTYAFAKDTTRNYSSSGESVEQMQMISDSLFSIDSLKIASVSLTHKIEVSSDPLPLVWIKQKRLIKQKISNFLENFKLLSTRQCRFWSLGSTQDALSDAIKGFWTAFQHEKTSSCSGLSSIWGKSSTLLITNLYGRNCNGLHYKGVFIRSSNRTC